MKKILIAASLIFILCDAGKAQKYFTKNGSISFFSATSLENIKADNNQVMSVLNTATGDLQFSVLVKSFHFKKALMEEHFNENYMESEKFPKSTFKGTVTDISKVNFTKDGAYPVTVSGDLTMHGVTQKLTSSGTINVSGSKITGNAVFTVALADYKISVPKVVQNNISKTIEITINCLYDQKM
jgi:polyisoprenoid-binding protein YceI